MKEEVWMDIKGYEGKYMVSNLGRVKSLKYRRTNKERILKVGDSGKGYLQVQLFKDGKCKHYYVHVLVATAFCENPMGYSEVNHIDEDKANNKASNLEFCSRSYNNTYNDRAKKIGEKLKGRKQSEEQIKKKGKPLFSIAKESGLIIWWQSASEAARQLGICQTSVTKCCKGKVKSTRNYIFFYAD